MSRRVPSVATLKRLAAIESSLLGNEDGSSRRGVLLIPRTLGCDEWEAIAVCQQQKLSKSAAEDIELRCQEAVIRPMQGPVVPLVEGVHFHPLDPNRRQAARAKEAT